MDSRPLEAVVAELGDHVRAGTTELAPAEYHEPVAAYTDPDRFEAERRLLFGGDVPLVAGLSAQLPEPFSMFPFHDYQVPLLLWRDGEGRVRAFINVCRHRGARVVQGAGSARRVTCGYHGWTYDAGGRLVGVPGAAGFSGIDRSCRSLVEVPAAEAGGLVLVKPRAGAAAFDPIAYLAGLAAELELAGVPGRHYLTERTLERPVNWKAAMDTFGEVYHFAYTHRDTLALRTVGDTMVSRAFGPHQRFCAPTRTIVDYGTDPALNAADVISTVYLIHPNAVLLVSTRSVQLFTVVPGDVPGRSLMRQRFFSPHAPADGDEERQLLEVCDFYHAVVRDEDWSKAESIEAGARSGANETLVFGRNELCLHRMHDAWRAGLGLPPLAVASPPVEVGAGAAGTADS